MSASEDILVDAVGATFSKIGCCAAHRGVLFRALENSMFKVTWGKKKRVGLLLTTYVAAVTSYYAQPLWLVR